MVQQQKHGSRRRKFEKQQRQAKLQQHSRGNDPPRHAKPVLAQHPGEEQDCGNAEKPAHRAASGGTFGG